MLALFGVGAAKGGPLFDLAWPVQGAGGDDEGLEKRRFANATSTHEGDRASLRVTERRNHGNLDSTGSD
jgi:hypothetical protein